jgi:hypothetical protein
MKIHLFFNQSFFMKQKLLLSCCLLGSILGQAQFIDATNYRGAFAPAPAKQWTDNWTNFDPQNAVYPATNVTVNADINANTTWTNNNTYLLQGKIYVNDGFTLTIQPGTVIRGSLTDLTSSLIVAKGGKLIAEGTECQPIVFTSNQPAGSRATGDWGGVILLGKADNNATGANALIEGLVNSDPRNFHGGNDDADNSGSLKYVRLEYGGYIFSANNEINGLTMGSVGSATTIDYVQVSFNQDDAFEWFGGTVNCKHLVAYRTKDDDFDTDLGYRGQLQYCLGIKDPAFSDVSESNGFESDNTPSAGSNGKVTPKTSPAFHNVTLLGAYRCGYAGGVDALHWRAAHLRRNTEIDVYNSIFIGFRDGIHIQDNSGTYANFDAGRLNFKNNLVAGNYTANPAHKAWFDAGTRTRLTALVHGNDSTNSGGDCAAQVLVNAFPANYLNPDFRPNTSYFDPGGLTSVSTTAPNLFAFPDIQVGGFNAGAGADFGVFIGEEGSGIANGTVTLTIPKVAGFDITVPGLTLSGTPQLGTNGTTNGQPNNNGDWLFSDDGANIIVTLKPGAAIAKGGNSIPGLYITRQIGSAPGISPIVVTVTTANDSNASDNTGVITVILN